MAHIPLYAYARSEKKRKNIANNPTLSLVVRKGEVGDTTYQSLCFSQSPPKCFFLLPGRCEASSSLALACRNFSKFSSGSGTCGFFASSTEASQGNGLAGFFCGKCFASHGPAPLILEERVSAAFGISGGSRLDVSIEAPPFWDPSED